ncbi:MAG: hypothetical protein L7U56_07730 [Acidimicrobiales bacterium]|nr:hypothetical protein [Acidimicrobiales bacterium]
MTVEKNTDWGRQARPPRDLAVFDDSAAAVAVLTNARRANEPLPPIGLRGGDLVRTLGGPTVPDLTTAEIALHVTVDLGAVLADGHLHWFLDHLVARRTWLRGQVLVAANAAFFGAWNIAPRAHPGDGMLDTLETSSMSAGDRWKARRRLSTGTHLPHPDIRMRRTSAAQFGFDTPTPVWLDGRQIGRFTSLSVRIEADAVDVWL